MHPAFSFFNRLLRVTTLSLLITIIACKPSPGPAKKNTVASSDELKHMQLENIPGSDIQFAHQADSAGTAIQEGYVLNGKKTGEWISYTPDGDIQIINHYVDNQLEGTQLQMGFRNQVDLKSTYRSGQLNGPWVRYKFGKKVEERTYKNGKLDGTVYLYDDRTFKVKQETDYKDGVQDGVMKYYDEAGNVTVEYKFEKGQKISGGMVKRPE